MALIRACGRDSSMRLPVTDGLARCWRRRPAREGKAPTELPLQIEAVPALPHGPGQTYADVRFGGDFETVTASTPKHREVLPEKVKTHVTASGMGGPVSEASCILAATQYPSRGETDGLQLPSGDRLRRS